VIRQAISCDVCGTEMLSANHWFIAREHGTELRISIWNAQVRFASSARHLCGHKCLHKFLDDFLAEKSQVCPTANCDEASRKESPLRTDTSLTSRIASAAPRLPVIGSCAIEAESSARLLPDVQQFPERTPARRLRSEAWKREMERERRQRVDSHRSIAHGALSVIHALVQPAQQDD